MSSHHPRRSVLYVPGGNERALAKAPGLAADVLILDLEDAVAPSEKPMARARAAAFLAAPRPQQRPELVVRVNALATTYGRDDIATLLPLAPDGLLVPKVTTPDDLAAVRALAAAIVPGSATALWAMVETARAVADPLAIALDRSQFLPLAALVLGLNDLAAEMGTRQLPGRAPMLPLLMAVLAAGRAGGLDVIDGVFNDLRDGAGFEAECLQGRDCGFDGKSLIHPGQIGPANRAFAPDGEALARARRIAGLFDAPEHAGLGVVVFEGRMVERLHAEAARRLVARADAIASRRREVERHPG